MTKRESLLISAYTGYHLTKDINDLLEFISDTLGRPVFTHELVYNTVCEELRKKLGPEINELVNGITDDKKEGVWIIDPDGYYPYCSLCKHEPKYMSGYDNRTPYCPNCGAKMRKEYEPDGEKTTS